MTNSLKEQLLKTGLVSEEQLRRSQNKTKKAGSQKRKRQDKARKVQRMEARQPAPATAEEKAAIKARKAQIREFLRNHKLNRDEADIAYYFPLGKATKHMYVTRQQQQLLAEGQLAILVRNERHYLLSLADTEALRKLDANSDIFIDNRPAQSEGDSGDPYADFKVPDDLQW